MILSSRQKILSLVSCLSFLALEGCVPAIIGGGTAVTTSAAEERGLGGVISDTEIKARIISLYSESDYALNDQVTMVVRQGNVLLTGTVESPKAHMEAVRLAWAARGTREVHDELKTGQESEGFGTMAKDSWISTQLKTKILFDEKIHSINYSLHTIEGVVYLMGIAKTQEELQHLIQVAKGISGVQKVVSYVRIAPKTHVKAPPVPMDTQGYPKAKGPSNGPSHHAAESWDQPNDHSAFD